MTSTAKFYASAFVLRMDHWVSGTSLGRRAAQAGLRRIGALPSDHTLVRLYFQSRRAPSFHFSESDIAGIIDSVPMPLKLETIGSAEAIVRGRFAFRELGQLVFESEVDWRATIDDNVSWRWDLNRHRYFIELATAHHYTGERRYLSRLSALWEHWIARNPSDGETNWDQPFEVAARLNNWLWAFFLLLQASRKEEVRWVEIVSSMTEHAAHLYRTLEYHWPNNHLLLEAKALMEFGMLFPEFDPDRRFLRRGRAILLREIECEVLPDGGHSELSSMYHRIVAGELSEWLLVARRNSISIPDALAERIARMASVTAALSRPDGTVALLGDSAADDNYIRFDPARRDARHLNYWLLPEPSVPASRAVTTTTELLTLLPDMGYAVIRDQITDAKVHITVDVGQFIRNPAPDHGHCDALSFELYAGDRPLLIDPGVFFPNRDAGPWRQYFRGTSAHNTVSIDGREQSELLAMSDVGDRAEVRLLGSSSAGRTATVRASVRPYWAATAADVLHTRAIRYTSPGSIDVEDDITGAGEHTLTWHYHFAADLDVSMDEERGCEARDSGGRIVLHIAPVSTNGNLSGRLVRGCNLPRLGWVSLNSTLVSPTTVAVYEVRRALPFRAEFKITCLLPRTSGSGDQPAR
ncbi:MAG: alginate lyase family protein [Anaerolineae bacterium]|nr:alginate lyase family protein [Gemmatimonadaceae bacterium]